MTRVQSAAGQLEHTIDTLKETLAAGRGSTGFVDGALYVDRTMGRAAEVTFWENAQAMAGSERMALQARAEAAGSRGLSVIDVTRFHVVVLNRARPPGVTGAIRVDNGSTPPERLDAFATFVSTDLVPALRTRQGYRSLAVAIDRTSGLLAVTTTWETAADREAGDASFAMVLHRAAEFQMRPILIEFYEQVGVTQGTAGLAAP